ncbi:MAG: alpha-amylase family glycosyl hydrolase [Candidatus Micrarchaeia archaeon]
MKKLIFLALLTVIIAGCQKTSKLNSNQKDSTKNMLTVHNFPERIKHSVIYEVNIRQYTPEGTFAAFEKHLPRLQQLGVDILWFMPIQPIGKKNRKGELGSYYSIADYTAVNPEFGTLDDFKRIVKKAHEMGMLVILDWVANHTAFDHVWITQHPDFYTKNEKGEIISPVPDWTDVADLNYDNQQMRQAMIDAMAFWVKECDIDGFRCDVAMMVPTDFWEAARVQLEKIKPLFMLAEAEEPELMNKAFDMFYSWEFYHHMVDIAKNKRKAKDLIAVLHLEQKKFPTRAIPMRFTSNHDENSWNGTDKELYSDKHKLFAVLTFMVNGMPLIYSGQEAENDKRLRFFYKDTIDWKSTPTEELYKKLIQFRKENSALWTTGFGAPMNILPSRPEYFAFYRKNDTNTVVCFFNFSDKKQIAYIDEPAIVGEYNVFGTDEKYYLRPKKDIVLEPWAYFILYRKK